MNILEMKRIVFGSKIRGPLNSSSDFLTLPGQ